MFALLLGASVFIAAQPPNDTSTHEGQNPLYRSLIETGLPIGSDIKTRIPGPTMPDGLDGAKQKAILMNLLKDEYSFEDFARKSIVSPYLLKLRDVSPSDPKAPARGVDVWFIAYGDLKVFEDEKFLDRLLNAGKGDGTGVTLTKDDLAKRKIAPIDEKREAYGHIEFDFLEKVHLKATGRAVWSKTADSVLVAAEIDPRFRGDEVFPNQWQPIIKDGGSSKRGSQAPWDGAGLYIKITRLAEPAGALLVEQHIVFTEPMGWFDGANLLRSKLPIAIQSSTRTMRKELVKGTDK
jgi:hypothetical protein